MAKYLRTSRRGAPRGIRKQSPRFREDKDMASAASSILRHVEQFIAVQPTEVLSDHQLVERFVRERDEAAFAAIVRRHGGMILGLCRRILRHEQDAEDAFQAAF